MSQVSQGLADMAQCDDEPGRALNRLRQYRADPPAFCFLSILIDTCG